MRDKFRKSANTLSSKPSERSDRGRPREREHRPPPGTQKDRSRDRDFVKTIKHKSRSPLRSSKQSSLTTTSISRNLETNRKIERNLDNVSRVGGGRGDRKRVHDDDRGQHPRTERDLLKGKLRMDHGDREREREREPLSRNKQPSSRGSNIINRFQELARSGEHPRKQPPGELDRVVQRAKEERSSYWNKRVIEAEEKDPNRWGHSGFKELYGRRDKPSPDHQRARSPSPNIKSKHFRSPGEGHHRHRDIPPRRSRSRSPRNKSGNSRNDLRRSITPPKQQRSSNSNFVPLGPRPTGGSARRISPLLSRVIPDRKTDRDRRYVNAPSSSRVERGMGGGDSAGRRTILNEKSHGSKSSSRNIEESKSTSTNDSYRRNDRERERQRENNSRGGFRDSSASRSRSRSKTSPIPRSSGNSRGTKGDLKTKDSRNRTVAKSGSKVAALGSRSRSKSVSSSSSSSEDEDVLQLHADDRRKGRGASSISRSSSSSDSKSNSSSSSQNSSSNNKKTAASDSSSSSSSDSDTDDSDVSGKISMQKTKKSGTTEPSKTKEAAEAGTYKSKSSSEGKTGESRTGTKRPSSAATSAPSKAARSSASKNSASKSSRDKEKTTTARSAGSKGDSDSDSGSSSDSEPRMTLSERFAKLTQMSTDKREFAKPLLSVNEIDTKLKVVKDLRNADMKIYVDGPHGQQQRTGGSSSTNLKPRPKSPEYSYAEGEKRYTSDERRRHFERMERDEPRERPADWSDSRVRFEYYRDRGYFSDRPLTFEEYVKWEEWWYQYRDWLYDNGYPPPTRVPAGVVPRVDRNFPGIGEGSRQSRNGSEWNPSGMSPRLRLRPGLGDMPPGRRVEQVPGRLVPLSSRPHFIGRPEDRESMGRLGPMDTRTRAIGGGGGGQFMGERGRAIGRAAGGSLIVNIRQGNSNYGPRGRHVGLLRGRNR